MRKATYVPRTSRPGDCRGQPTAELTDVFCDFPFTPLLYITTFHFFIDRHHIFSYTTYHVRTYASSTVSRHFGAETKKVEERVVSMLSCLCVQVSTATMAQPQGHFGYRIVRIIKTSSLGIGSYGAVYRALCDELPCAAKIVHPTLFETNDPGTRKILERFEQECQFLSGVRHPHIVQYLGVSRDPESGLPVLLMELMDSSLTRFLEQSEEPLRFHTQVDICHDIALALAYLHLNGIAHRDLSSNNVLLIGSGYRAKVTDFGMSKLADANPRMTPMTMCPGTLAYMPPEALKDPPVYSKKLDCFSFGVLGVQITTRQFPDPSVRFRTIDITDPRIPSGTVDVPVPEVERRRSHIDLVDPAHPLLPAVLHCLKDRDRERPSAQELCNRVAALKDTPQYGESVQQRQRATTDGERVQIRELQAEAQERQCHNVWLAWVGSTPHSFPILSPTTH